MATTKTDLLGLLYVFSNFEPGDYTFVEVNPVGFPSSLSDYDYSNDGDSGDKDTTVDNTIAALTWKPSEDNEDYNFVDSDRGSISGSFRDDKGNPLVGADVVLKKADGTIVATATTNPSGHHTFDDVDPGDWR